MYFQQNSVISNTNIVLSTLGYFVFCSQRDRVSFFCKQSKAYIRVAPDRGDQVSL